VQLDFLDERGQVSGKVDVSDLIFGRPYNEALIHQIVVAYQANARRGTRAQLGRNEVAHSTKKPFRQKGTGRARAGMTSSPIWRGGGRAFPSSPDENFCHKVNKKMYRAGMASMLSQLVREERFAVVPPIQVEMPKTKIFAQKVKPFLCGPVLFLMEEISQNLELASRNFIDVAIMKTTQVNPLSLILYKRILVTEDSVKSLQEMFA
jgi:large subunit ribosomal protein L4